MTTAESWTTAADLAAARGRFEAAIPGWRTPAAFGMGTVAPGAGSGPAPTPTPTPASASTSTSTSTPTSASASASGGEVGASVEFPVANAGGAALSAVVLATACGHRAGTASYELTVDQVARAVDLLAPAEAYTAVPHPNMAAWRAILERLRADDGTLRAVAVFVADLADPVADDHDAALRAAISADGS
ncbi:hypothetical protein OG216_05030 [Streptomycetaceae bacterium NBC_01309]